jgi:cardiolipin synthase
MLTAGALLLALAVLFAIFPKLLIYPLVLVLVWFGVALLYRGYKLRGSSVREAPALDETVRSEGRTEVSERLQSKRE